jgi:hypothetical protein
MMKKKLISLFMLLIFGWAQAAQAGPWTVGRTDQSLFRRPRTPRRRQQRARRHPARVRYMPADIASNFTESAWENTCGGGCGEFDGSRAGDEAKARFDCEFGFTAKDDPIVNPGATTAHRTSTTSSATASTLPASMLPTRPTPHFAGAAIRAASAGPSTARSIGSRRLQNADQWRDGRAEALHAGDLLHRRGHGRSHARHVRPRFRHDLGARVEDHQRLQHGRPDAMDMTGYAAPTRRPTGSMHRHHRRQCRFAFGQICPRQAIRPASSAGTARPRFPATVRLPPARIAVSRPPALATQCGRHADAQLRAQLDDCCRPSDEPLLGRGEPR